LFERGLCLPSSTNLGEIDQHRVIDAVRDAVAAARARRSPTPGKRAHG
jgi:hypothetical protein